MDIYCLTAIDAIPLRFRPVSVYTLEMIIYNFVWVSITLHTYAITKAQLSLLPKSSNVNMINNYSLREPLTLSCFDAPTSLYVQLALGGMVCLGL